MSVDSRRALDHENQEGNPVQARGGPADRLSWKGGEPMNGILPGTTVQAVVPLQRDAGRTVRSAEAPPIV